MEEYKYTPAEIGELTMYQLRYLTCPEDQVQGALPTGTMGQAREITQRMKDPNWILTFIGADRRGAETG